MNHKKEGFEQKFKAFFFFNYQSSFSARPRYSEKFPVACRSSVRSLILS